MSVKHTADDGCDADIMQSPRRDPIGDTSRHRPTPSPSTLAHHHVVENQHRPPPVQLQRRPAWALQLAPVLRLSRCQPRRPAREDPGTQQVDRGQRRDLLSAFETPFAGNWSFLDCSDVLGGCVEDCDAVGRSDLVLAAVRIFLDGRAASEALTLLYECRHRSFPWGISHLFLIINVIVSSSLLRRVF